MSEESMEKHMVDVSPAPESGPEVEPVVVAEFPPQLASPAVEQQESRPAERRNFQRDPINTIIWALILMWAGVVLIADRLVGMPESQSFLSPPWCNWIQLPHNEWSYVLLGSGLILLVQGLVLTLILSRQGQGFWTLVLAIVLVGLGLQGFAGVHLIWPALLILVGFFVFLRTFRRR